MGLHHIVYPLSWFGVPGGCQHSHVLVRRSDDFNRFTLPEGKYRTALDVTEGILQCLNNDDSPSKPKITVDEEWNVTLNSLEEEIMFTVSTARALGWITDQHTVKPGIRLNKDISLIANR